MKEQVLSIEQMKHLQELGADTSKASCRWEKWGGYEMINGEATFTWGKLQLCIGYRVSDCRNYKSFPAFTLQDLMDIIPLIIRSDAFESFSLRIRGYKNDWEMYYDTLEDSVSSKLFSPIEGDTLLEAAYNMLCYLAEKNLLGKEEKK